MPIRLTAGQGTANPAMASSPERVIPGPALAAGLAWPARPDYDRGVLARLLSATLLAAAALGTVGAAPGIPATTPALSIDSATVSARWRESWLTATLRFAGSAGAAADLTATLRPADRAGPPAARARMTAAADGQFSGTMKLPPRLLPGRYLLRVFGTSGTTQLTPVERSVTVPAPVEGVVDRASTSTTRNGAPTINTRGPRSVLWARFHFLVPPKSGRVTASWYTPSFKWVGTVTRAYKTDFVTFVRGAPSLERGRWWCFLRSSGRVVKRVRIRIN
jgi:hypothetical protein